MPIPLTIHNGVIGCLGIAVQYGAVRKYQHISRDDEGDCGEKTTSEESLRQRISKRGTH
jgi:hypothetical protein